MKAPQGNYFFEDGQLVDQNLFTVYQLWDKYFIGDSNGELVVDSNGIYPRINDEETNRQIQEMIANLSEDYIQRQHVEEQHVEEQQVEEMVAVLMNACGFNQMQSQSNTPADSVMPTLRFSKQLYVSMQFQQQSQTVKKHDYKKYSGFDEKRVKELFGDLETFDYLKYLYSVNIKTKKALDFYVSRDGKSIIYFGKFCEERISKSIVKASFIDAYEEKDMLMTVIKPKKPVKDITKVIASEVLDNKKRSKKVVNIASLDTRLVDTSGNTKNSVNYKPNLGILDESLMDEFFGRTEYFLAAKDKFINTNLADSNAYLSTNQTGIICFLKNTEGSLRDFLGKHAPIMSVAKASMYKCGDDIICFIFTPQPKKTQTITIDTLISRLNNLGKKVVPIDSVLDVLEFNPVSGMQRFQQPPTTTTTTTTTTTYRPTLFDEMHRDAVVGKKHAFVDSTSPEKGDEVFQPRKHRKT